MAFLTYADKQYPLIEKLIVGRQKTCDIRLNDQGASREHCKIYHDSKQRVWAEDLGSANGTKVNGTKINAPTKLKDGDTIVCSKSMLTITFDEHDKEQNRSANDLFNPESLVGELIEGHRIQSIIGSTNIVTVYIAKQLSLDRDVVLKIVHPNFADADSPLAREISEQTKTAARINHQSIAQVHECGTERNFIWSTMELVDGDMLFDLLDREGQLPPDVALMVAEKIADGLDSAHKEGIVHRALNPRNIMLSKDGRVKVVDLILEQFLRHHLEQKNIPTPEDHADYLAPELLRGKRGGAKSDIYSLGCILFQMLSGQPPYVFETAEDVATAHIKGAIPNIVDFCPDLPVSISELVSTMLHKNPEWRHQSMGELRNDIAAIRAEMPKTIGEQKARRVERPSQRLPVASRGKGMAITINVLIFAALALMIWYFYIKDPDLFKDTTPNIHRDLSTTNDDPDNITLDTDLEKLKQQIENNDDRPEQVNRALQAVFQETKDKANNAVAAGEWDRAEYIVLRSIPHFSSSRTLSSQASNLLNQIQLDGRAWYEEALAAVHSGSDIDDLRQRCIELNRLRSKVLNESRADVEARYQQALTSMQRHLSRARQAAIGYIENGELDKLTASVQEMKSAFTGTVLEQTFAQFAALVKEAARINYQGDWQSTRQQLKQASGAEDVLAAGAALILSGNTDHGTRLLLKNDAFNTRSLQRRRDALLRSQAAILDFKDNNDLRQLEFILGQPGLGDGYISGQAGTLYEFRPYSVLGNEQWEVGCDLRFPNGLSSRSEMVLQFGKGDELPLIIRIDKDNVIARTKENTSEHETPMSYSNRQPLRLRLFYSEGTATVLVNNKLLTESALLLPEQCRLTITCTNSNWQLHQLQFVGASE